MSGETRGYGTGEQQTPFMKDVSKVGGVVANVLRKINSAMEVAGAGVGDYFEGTNLMDTAGPRFDKAWGLNNNTPPVAAPVQPVAKQVASPNPPVNTQPVEPVPIMPSVTSPVVVTSTDSAAPLGVGAKPFDADPTGRVQRERDSAYANRVQTKNDIQNDIDRIMSERKLDEMTNWAGRGLGIGQYQSKYGADVLPELMKLKEGANLNASNTAQHSMTNQIIPAYGLEGHKAVAAAHENAARLTSDAHVKAAALTADATKLNTQTYKTMGLQQKASADVQDLLTKFGTMPDKSVNPELALYRMASGKIPLPTSLSEEDTKRYRSAMDEAIKPLNDLLKEVEVLKKSPLTATEIQFVKNGFEKSRGYSLQ